MNVKIKICGLTRKEDIEAANEVLPEYIGFVFARMSKRYISPERAEILSRQVSPRIRKTGVFVKNDISLITDLAERQIIDVIQLHGQEDETYVRELLGALETIKRPRREIQVIQAFSISNEEDIRKAEESLADLILLDQGKGGTGTCFNWKLAEQVSRPFFLAGGLKEENIEEAIERTRPYGVDISSGAETNGVKDREKIKRIIRRIRDGKGQIRSPRRTVYTGNADE